MLLYLRVYDKQEQSKGSNLCAVSNGDCSHLCLPISNTERVCECAISFKKDPINHTLCTGPSVFLMYSSNLGIKGTSITPSASISNFTNSSPHVMLPPIPKVVMLPPIPKVVMASRIDFSFHDHLIFWVDSEDGSITAIKRDTTGFRNIIRGLESIDGIAVDWIAKNIYWIDPSYDVIEVARLNGTHRMVVVSGEMDKPNSIAVHPLEGFLFWSDTGSPTKIERSRLDGTDRMVLANDSNIEMMVNDIAVDLLEKQTVLV